jgi:hypothetical protein
MFAYIDYSIIYGIHYPIVYTLHNVALLWYGHLCEEC